MERTRSERTSASKKAAADDQPLTRGDVAELVAMVQELDRRIARNREDINVQFQRLADLQAVIDRIQIAAGRARTKRGRGGEL